MQGTSIRALRPEDSQAQWKQGMGMGKTKESEREESATQTPPTHPTGPSYSPGFPLTSQGSLCPPSVGLCYSPSSPSLSSKLLSI